MNNFIYFSRKLKRVGSYGQGLVEIALLIPLLVLFVIGAIDLARAFHAQVTITNASREGARYAMRINKDSQILDKLTAIKMRVADEAGSSGITVSTSDVTVNCGGSSYVSVCDSGLEIEVIVDYQFTLIVGSLLFPDIFLSHSTKMVAP